MKTYTGKGVYSAVAIGKISLFKKQDESVSRTRIEDTEAEKNRYDKAREMSSRQLEEIYEKALKEVGEAHAAIFQIHQMMLEDDDYNDYRQSDGKCGVCGGRYLRQLCPNVRLHGGRIYEGTFRRRT